MWCFRSQPRGVNEFLYPMNFLKTINSTPISAWFWLKVDGCSVSKNIDILCQTCFSWQTNDWGSSPTGWQETTSLLSNLTRLKRCLLDFIFQIGIFENNWNSKVGYEDVHPSFIAISWEGMDYDSPLRDRTRVCKEFIDFIVTLRSSKQTTRIIDHAYLFDPTISPEHIGDVLIYIHSFFSLIIWKWNPKLVFNNNIQLPGQTTGASQSLLGLTSTWTCVILTSLNTQANIKDGVIFSCWNLYWLGFLLRDQYHSIPTKVWQKQRDEEHLSLHHGQHPGDC